MKRKINNKNLGFSIVKILQVVAILGVITGIAMMFFSQDVSDDLTPSNCRGPQHERCWSDESPEYLVWGPRMLETGAQSTTDGRLNTNTLLSMGESFPAAEYCQSLNEQNHKGYSDWYLPSSDELWSAWQVNDRTLFTSEDYWSSTEISASPDNNANLLITNPENMNNAAKNYSSSVRCLR